MLSLIKQGVLHVEEQDANTFSCNPLDKSNTLRLDEIFITSLNQSESSKFILFHSLKPLLTFNDQIYYLSVSDLQPFNKEEILHSTTVLLGLLEGIAYFVIDVSNLPDDHPLLQWTKGNGRFEELRSSASRLSKQDAGILAQGRAILNWHSRHRYCAVCGSLSKSIRGGMKRICTNETCKSEHFPRTDPVVIMLVIHPDKKHCLLGRKNIWPKGMYSALAGFMEPGESVEEAVRRETREEAGIEVGKVIYHSSQPWPYPSQLMSGCFAEAITDSINIDEHELEEAKWFTIEEVRKAYNVSITTDPSHYMKSTEFRIPLPIAIAHQLVKAWVKSFE